MVVFSYVKYHDTQKIHSTLCEHRLIRLMMKYEDAKLELLVLVTLGSTAIMKSVCSI